MKDLCAIFTECINDVEAAGITPGNIVNISINTRAKKRWGCAKQVGKFYKIEISDRLLQDEVDDKATKNTIVHEILHTVDGCMNHGENWKAVADKMNRTYPDVYNIKRTTSSEEKGIAPSPVRPDRWELTCQSCGHTWRYKRAPKYSVSAYACPCGGKLKMKSLVDGIDVWSI